MTDIVKKILDTKKNICVGMAGPGTGKSYTFKRIIESSQYANKKILILSFINKLVDDLKMDFKDFNDVEVSTLHAFAFRLLNFTGNEIILEEKLDDVLSEDFSIMNGSKCKYDEKFQTNTLTGTEEDFHKKRRLFYKKREGLHSFNSIVYALNKFFEENKDKIPQYDLILVDEFQDFNPLECRMIELLTEKSKVVVVGDDDQALYGFKNATPKLIRDLYESLDTEDFTLPDCYRCTKVIVEAVNDVIKNAKEKGFLNSRIEKEYNYPPCEEKDEISRIYSCIEYKQSTNGDELFYFLSNKIKNDVGSETGKKRILILIPDYLIHHLAIGLIKCDINIVNVELMKKQSKKAKKVLEAFHVLKKTKTDNFSLRYVLHKYIEKEKWEDVIKKDKSIWSCLDEEIKKRIEKDIDLYRKCTGRENPNSKKKEDFIRTFNINIPLEIMINGIGSMSKNAPEVEIVTPMSSKGLSADYVYYFIEDSNGNRLTDTKICEFLVGMTRAKEKLVFISRKNKFPEILGLIDQGKIKVI